MASLNWERFTQEAKLSLSNAQTFALQLKQVTITAEHLLYGLLEITNCDAVQVLLSLNVDISELKNKLQTHLQSLPTAPTNELTPTLSDSLKNILQKAVQVFREQKFAHVNTLCLLLAFFHLPKLPATQFLQQVNLPPEIVLTHMTHESVSNEKTSQTFSSPTSKTEGVSSVFIGLVFIFIILGYVNYTTLTTNGITVFLFVTVGWLISLALHEFAHAAVAYWAGDHNVKQKGYLTLNPLMYTDWLYSLVYPLLIMAVGGIGLPGAAVYINSHLIIGRFRKSLVSAAGPVASLVLTGLLAIPFWLNLPQQSPFHYPFWAGMALLAYLHITVVALCLLPIPGLDGFGIWQPYLPSNLKNITNSMHQYSFLLVIIVFFTPNPLQTGFWQLINWLAQQIHLDITLVQTGYQFFQFWENGF